MISFSQDSCLASNGCPPPLGIPNRDSTCYAAVALHVLASVHDTSVTGVVNVSLPSGTVQKIVATISAGGSVGQQNMRRLLSLVEGADYETGKQQDAVEFLKKMYKFFCTLDQADNEETKVLKDNHERIFMKEIKHVQQGLLSDPPGV